MLASRGYLHGCIRSATVCPMTCSSPPQLDPQRAAQLTRLAKRLDEQLDHPTRVPQPVAQSGLLEQLGTLLWEATHLEADAVRTALDEARDAERPLRLVVQGEQAQHLPWELLYHAHP